MLHFRADEELFLLRFSFTSIISEGTAFLNTGDDDNNNNKT